MTLINTISRQPLCQHWFSNMPVTGIEALSYDNKGITG